MTREPAPIQLPAKLISPNLGRVVQRHRLFSLLDAREAPCLWAHGPPGSGKTTLVASYLRARKHNIIWIQLDADDQDFSTFFYFLSAALLPHLTPNLTASAQRALPVIENETRDDWMGFARRYFRAALMRLTDNDVIVFENVHEVRGALDELFALFVTEAGNQQQIIFTSHHAPPAALADAMAKRQLAELRPEALRFDLAETHTFINSLTKQPVEDADAQQLHALADGWAAGILLLGLRPQAQWGNDLDTIGSQKQLFDYFSHTVIERMSASEIDVAQCCAFFPDFDIELAALASGNIDCAEILNTLHANGHFVEKRMVNGRASYQLHGMFAQALRNLRGAPNSEARRAALRHAAELLITAHRAEAAIALFLEAGDCHSAATQILAIVETLIAQGRVEQVAGWIKKLPVATRATMPWLDYWLGLCFSYADESTARDVLSAAYQRFKHTEDALGCLMCSAAMVSNIFSGWQSFEGYTKWAATLKAHWSADMVFPSAESELRAFVALIGLLNSGVDVAVGATATDVTGSAARIADLPDRAVVLIKRVADTNAQLAAAVIVIEWLMGTRDMERAMYFANFIEREVPYSLASPSRQATWFWSLSLMTAAAAQVLRNPSLNDRGAQYQRTAATIANDHNLAAMRVNLAHTAADRCIWARDAAGACKALDSVDAQINVSRVRQMSWQMQCRAQVALLSGNYSEAWTAVESAIKLTIAAHYPARYMAAQHNSAANALLYLRRYDEALDFVARAKQQASLGHRKFFELNELFIHAIRALECDVPPIAISDATGQFFVTLREHHQLAFGRMLDPLLAKLCAAAFAHNIEPDFVRELILHRKFPPPANAAADWPWPLKIEALGGFKVSIAGTALAFDGKSQKKPLEMLQIMVTLQDTASGLGPKVGQVMDELWPSLEAKDPQGSFDTTLHRLRKLIGVDGAVALADGRLSFNRALVWCDVAAFETLAKTVTADAQAKALKLYAGALLDSTVYAWSTAPRERLAARYHALVEDAALHLEGVGDHKAAIALYERALQQDNLTEAFYRGLMRCYHAMGEDTQGLRAYRRCKELLLIVLNATPSRETEELKANLKD